MSAAAFSTGQRLAAWGVHAYTALGMPVAVMATSALYRGDARSFFIWLWIACFIDSTDGAMARRFKVKTVVPEFDGRKLDDLVDFLTYVFLPSLALPALGLIPAGWELLAVVPILASAYGFCQDRAKTEESFVGFPSYWNVLVLYFYVLGTSQLTNVIWTIVLAVLVFVPIHYIYPSRTRLLRPVTVVLGAAWAASLGPVCFFPDAPWARTIAQVSLVFIVWYFALSLVNHVRITREARTMADSGTGIR